MFKDSEILFLMFFLRHYNSEKRVFFIASSMTLRLKSLEVNYILNMDLVLLWHAKKISYKVFDYCKHTFIYMQWASN